MRKKRAPIPGLKDYLSVVAQQDEDLAEAAAGGSSQPPPLQLMFQRTQLIKIHNGRWVGLYREVRSGREIVLPMEV
jgi:hypothetical protein